MNPHSESAGKHTHTRTQSANGRGNGFLRVMCAAAGCGGVDRVVGTNEKFRTVVGYGRLSRVGSVVREWRASRKRYLICCHIMLHNVTLSAGTPVGLCVAAVE